MMLPINLLKKIYWKIRNFQHNFLFACDVYGKKLLEFCKSISKSSFLFLWPILFLFISKLNRIIPQNGKVRNTFENIVFKRYWERYYKLAYIPNLRDVFFEHIVTFFYRYPIRKGDVIVQVGASSGEEAIRFARAVGKSGKLIAVEPEAKNLIKLKTCFPKKAFPQVTIIGKGAWNVPGQLSFFVGGEKEHRLVDLSAEKLTYEWWGVEDHLQAHRYKDTTTIEVDTVDSIVSSVGVTHIDFILFETNGAELEGVISMDSALAITKRVAARGHVMRNDVPIYHDIQKYLELKGFETTVTSEGMVLAQRPYGWRMPLVVNKKV